MDKEQKEPLNLDAIRARLAGAKGKQYWKSLEELAETDEFREFLDDEFPNRLSLPQLDRRDFLKFLGASLAVAGIAGCRFLPQDHIVPYVKMPEELVPGLPVYYASAIPFRDDSIGIVVESHEGRPTKIEGNALHPSSLGATDSFTQASIMTLYDPDRSTHVVNKGTESTWESFLVAARAALDAQRASKGAGLRLLTEPTLSPTLQGQIQDLLKRYPNAKWCPYDPLARDNVRAGAKMAFGEEVNTYYDLKKATVILSLDADFLYTMPGHVRYARDFADGRRVRKDHAEMNRLYMVESTPTITGAMADHKKTTLARDVQAVAQQVGVAGVTTASSPVPAAWIDAVMKDLKSGAPGTTLVIAGDEQPPAVHALVHAINQTLGNVGKTVLYTAPLNPNTTPDSMTALRELVDDMKAGHVEALFIVGGNPAFTAPADIDFAGALQTYAKDKERFSAHLGLYEDETAALCAWHAPEAHFLEAWSDTRAYDGTVSIVQPLIAPLYEGKSAHELVGALLNDPRKGYDLVRDHWEQTLRIVTVNGTNVTNGEPFGSGDRTTTRAEVIVFKNDAFKNDADFEKKWRQILNDGVVPNTKLPTKAVTLRADAATQAATSNAQGMEILFRPDPTIWDGRHANNGWLQELPKTMTKLTWDNAVLINPKTAEKLKLASQDVVEILYNKRTLRGPIWLTPGHPEEAITIHVGYGRTKAGKMGTGIGFNAYALRTSDAPWFGGKVELHKTGDTYQLISTQDHQSMRGSETQQDRDIVRAGTLEEFKKNPTLVESKEGEDEDITLFDAPEDFVNYDGPQWGMSIDNTVCIGCNTCTIACQAENNISVVGKDQVMRGRLMHWIRVDRYYEGDDLNSPKSVSFMPIPCMHCEKAPCEPVCPVGATMHSHEGLNQMVYNRCVGTRYCSNNCPYKVRRFNFYKYVAGQPNDAGTNYDNPVMKLLANPNVTLRGRGVMEKCTYCVQRINAARIEAKKAGRDIGDGEVVTACQQACPTNAIVFGDVSKKADSQVKRLKSEPHDYSLLKELNTRPRTTYLAKLRNPNPELES